MSTIRLSLGRLTLACLLSQAIGVAAPPAIAWMTSGTSDCTCAIGDHAMCPMHHHGSKTGCAIRAAADDGTAMLTPLTFVALLTPVSHAATPSAFPAIGVPGTNNFASSLHAPPDSPPPRT